MAVGNPYTEVSIVNYNVTPPTDDGAQTANNTVGWAKHKDKLADPVKTGHESTQTNITAAFDLRLLNSIGAQTGAYTILVADRGKIINFTGTSASTFTLPTAVTAKVGFELCIRNFGTAVLTLDGASAETVDGVATVDLYPGQVVILMCDGTNWVVQSKSLKPGVLAKTFADTPYTVLVDDDGRVVDVDASGGAVTVNLPAVATAKNGFLVVVQKSDSSTNAVTVDADGAETINGQTTYSLPGQYTSATFICDGVEWFIASRANAPMDFVASQTADNTANNIDFTDLTTQYDEYVLKCINVRPATDDVEAWLRLSDDNGSTFKAGASDYRWGQDGALNTAAHIIICAIGAGASLSNVADDFFNATISIWQPAESGKTHITAQVAYLRADAASIVVRIFYSWYNTAVATDAVRFLLESGNIAEGQFNLYGMSRP